MVRSTESMWVGAAVAVLLTSWLTGCVSRSQADARVQAAYVAGQKSAYLATGASPHDAIGITGPVKHPKVPWVAGLTLVQAIATAEYTGRHNPKQITITRHGVPIDVNPADLLRGRAIPLEPGDTVTLSEEKDTPKPQP